jgi:hypothetical protein
MGVLVEAESSSLATFDIGAMSRADARAGRTNPQPRMRLRGALGFQMHKHRRALTGAEPLPVALVMGLAIRKSIPDETRFTDSLRIRCPASLPAAIGTAAARNMMTPSEYVRRSVFDRLKADGVDPVAMPLRAER